MQTVFSFLSSLIRILNRTYVTPPPQITKSRDPGRDFSSTIKKQEKVTANFSCRMCGLRPPKESTNRLECAHIYSHSTSPAWARRGGTVERWRSDQYVASVDNCLLLCSHHHSQIDSPTGLRNCSVEYLESLKTNLTQCTALVKGANQWRRCQNSNGRGSKRLEYRCSRHGTGGLENTLPHRGFPSKK